MNQQITFYVLLIVTLVSTTATSIAASGEFVPAVSAVLMGVAAGCAAVAALLARPKG